jgi:hypothetical protein
MILTVPFFISLKRVVNAVREHSAFQQSTSVIQPQDTDVGVSLSVITGILQGFLFTGAKLLFWEGI